MCALRVLMLEDHAEDAELIALALHRGGIECDVTRVQTRDGLLSGLRAGTDIILSDYSLADLNAIEALTIVADQGGEVPVIVVTDAMSEESCVESLRHGACDYVSKGRLARLGPAVTQVLAGRSARAGHRSAEQATQRLALMLREVVKNSPTAMFVKDRHGRYLIANRQLEKMLGLAADSATGRTDQDLLPPRVVEDLAELDRLCLEGDRPYQNQEVFGPADDRRFYLSVRYPISTDGGTAGAIGGVYTDITTMRHGESDVRVARAELRNQASHRERDNLDIRELDHVKAQFIQSVSHELRTPLSIINGTVEMMLEADFGHLSPEERDLVAAVEKAGGRLHTTIMDLLTVFQMDRGGFALHARPTQLADVLRRAMHTIAPILADADIRDVLRIPARLPLVSVDGDQITRVLINLVMNAIKFSPEGSTITVSAHQHGREIVVSVRDTGAGIAAAEQNQIFLRFRRGSAALRRSAQGAGLGLAVSKEIVERHGGWIDLESDEEKGTTVTFALPLDADDASAPAGRDGPGALGVRPRGQNRSAGETARLRTVPDASEGGP